MKILKFIFDHTLNSVWFGIIMMVLVALYIAIGSGLPSVRAYFEMSSLEFFAAWPLKVLMVLLVASLAVVTFRRIPLTPPRYGVWCVHMGIILLIFGMGDYYNHKIEGKVMIPVGHTVTRFYDNESRMLYVRVNNQDICGHTLPGLPRFHEYTPALGNSSYFAAHGLVNLLPTYRGKPLGPLLGLKNLNIDIVGYYPYAMIVNDFADTGNSRGIKFTITAPKMGITQNVYLLCDDPSHSDSIIGSSDVRLIQFSDPSGIQTISKAALNIHTLDITLPGYHERLAVYPGGTYTLGKTGYTITVEGYDPNWPAMDGEHVKLITLMVRSPTQKFRRQVIMGRNTPTDWKLNVPHTGPMGQRQEQPLDDQLHIAYTFKDPFRLSPDTNVERHTILTLTGSNAITDVCVASDRAPKVTELKSGKGQIEMTLGSMRMEVGVEMKNDLELSQRVVPVPMDKRTRDGGESGAFQVVLCRVRSGDWSRTIPVPFTQFAEEPGVNWTEGTLTLPGGNAELELQLSTQIRPLPAALTLDKFQLVHYPGGNDASPVQKDFKSYLSIENLQTGQFTNGVAHMNHPVYYEAGDWTFFQAAYDSEGLQWTILGVGNRPAIWIMTSGFFMMLIGVMYAFYVKPIVIRKMKAKALEKARRRASAKAKEPVEALT